MNNLSIQEDEIDLREILKTLIKRKMTIFIVTFVTTISVMIYTWLIPPIYSGSVLLEVGEVVNNNQGFNNNQPTTIYGLDNINNLKEVITRATGVDVNIPSSTTNIIKLSLESSYLSEIKPGLENAARFIITRHQEKAKLYQNENSKILMTRMIGQIQISNEPIKPNKKLIVEIGLLSGLIMGIFLAFFLEFIGTRRNR